MDSKDPLRPSDPAPALCKAMSSWVEEIESLLIAGADANVRDAHQRTPLMYGISSESVAGIRLLLRSGADPRAQDEHGNSVLGYVYSVPDLWGSEIEQVLRDAGATDDGTLPGRLVGLAGRGSAASVEELLAQGVPPDVEGPWGGRALEHAAGCGHIDVVKLLLQKGADANHRRAEGGWTGLLEAARRGDLGIVQLLVEAGADPFTPIKDDCPSMTPRWYASANGHHDVVRYLREQEKRWKRASLYAKTTGLQNPEEDCTAMLVKASAGEVAEGILALGKLSGRQQNVLGVEAVLERRSYLLIQFKGHRWCAVYPLTPSTLDDPLREWARMLSARLNTNSLYYEHDEDAGSVYALYVSGKQVRGTAESARESTAYVERAANRLLRKERAYLYHVDPYRYGTGRTDMAFADLSPRDVECFDVLCGD